MRTVLRLIHKDLARRRRRAFTTIGAALMPLAMALLIGLVFGREGRSTIPLIKVVLVDLDQGILSAILRAGPAQSEPGERINLRVAESVDEGLRILEQEEASGLVVLPAGLTDDLLDGREVTLVVYRNPAQTILPEIVVQGTRIVALALSILSREFGEPLREIRAMFESNEPPPDWKIAALAVGIYGRIRAAEDYLDSPLITFESVTATEYTETISSDGSADHIAGSEP